MALRYAWFDSYGSAGYVLTLHISPHTVCPYLPIPKGAFFLETSTDSVPPPCKADVQQQQQQHKASLQICLGVVTSADMKAEDENHATPRTLTPG